MAEDAGSCEVQEDDMRSFGWLLTTGLIGGLVFVIVHQGTGSESMAFGASGVTGLIGGFTNARRIRHDSKKSTS